MNAPMLGKRTKHKLPWSQCDCGCRAGSQIRKIERRIQRKVEKNENRNIVSAQWAYAGGAW